MKLLKNTIPVLLFLLIIACNSTKKASSNTSNKTYKTPQILYNAYVITSVSKDDSYGYSKENPINVGGMKDMTGALNQRRYLNGLAGPNGENVTYFRAGSCCSFKSKNGIFGNGLLDIYLVTWENAKDTTTLYLNLYDKGELKIPVGFTSMFD